MSDHDVKRIEATDYAFERDVAAMTVWEDGKIIHTSVDGWGVTLVDEVLAARERIAYLEHELADERGRVEAWKGMSKLDHKENTVRLIARLKAVVRPTRNLMLVVEDMDSQRDTTVGSMVVLERRRLKPIKNALEILEARDGFWS